MDRRQPNPMIHAEVITIFNTFIQKQRLFQFLPGIHDTFDKEKRDLINQDPLPTVEMAYATIRRELSRRGIMIHTSSPGKIPSEIGNGLAVKRRSDVSFRRDMEDKTHLRFGHFGGSRHIKEGCFKWISFPEWWEEHRQRKAATKVQSARTGGKAHLVTGVPPPTSEPTHYTETKEGNNGVEGETEQRKGDGPEEREWGKGLLARTIVF